MVKKNIIAALDLGSSKISCLIAELEDGILDRIIGVGHQVAEGIAAGVIVDIRKAESSILAAINAAEKMAGLTIDEVVVAVSGSSVQSHHLSVTSKISGLEVTDNDIKQIIENGYKEFSSDHNTILDCIAIDYKIDDTQGIRSPIGMFGETLSTNLHVMTVSSTLIKNITNCLAKCHLNVTQFISSAYASGIACLSDDEKELGTTLIDIGASHSNIASFVNGQVMYVGSIGLGGGHVTRDIAKLLNTSLSQAERLKTLYGSVICTMSDEREMLTIHDEESEHIPRSLFDTNKAGNISKSELCEIIKPRMEELLELVGRKIESNIYAKSNSSRLVITGGTAQMQGMKEFTNHFFQKHARIAKPKIIEDLAEAMQGPAFSSNIGLILHIAELQSGGKEKNPFASLSNSGKINKMMRWFSDNF